MPNPMQREAAFAPLKLAFPIPEDPAFRVELSDREAIILLLAGISNLHADVKNVPSVAPTSQNITLTGGVAILRNSEVPAFVRIYNHGPMDVTIQYGTLSAVVNAFGNVLRPGDCEESPCPVVGQVTAVAVESGMLLDAIVTVTIFTP